MRTDLVFVEQLFEDIMLAREPEDSKRDESEERGAGSGAQKDFHMDFIVLFEILSVSMHIKSRNIFIGPFTIPTSRLRPSC